jgi:hypothetical protein
MAYKRNSPIPIVEGGTNATSMANTDGVVYFDGTTLNTTAVGSATQILTSNGAGMAPTFQNAPAGGITTIDGDSGSVTGSTITITGGTSGAVFTGAASTLTESFNYFSMHDTTSSTLGVLKVGGDTVLHFYDGVASNNIYLGFGAGNFSLSGGNNIGIGEDALNSLTTGAANTAVGVSGLSSLLTGNDNVAVGSTAGNAYTGAETNNICIGQNVTGVASESNVIRLGNSSATQLFLGNGSLGFIATSTVQDTFFGLGAYRSAATGNGNTGFGYNCGNAITGGGNNTFVGQQCGQLVAGSSYNVGIGSTALGGTGSAAVAIGFGALGSASWSGNNVIAIGNGAGSGYTGAEAENICIGSSVAGTGGESGVIRIGLNGTQTKAFITGIYGVTTTSSTTATVLVSNGDQLGTVSSSERFKDNIADMAEASSKIMELRPVTFTYKAHKDNVMQYGLIAEEVNQIMPEIVNLDDEGKPFAIRYHDLVPMLLNELQKLKKQIQELKNGR